LNLHAGFGLLATKRLQLSKNSTLRSAAFAIAS